MESRACATAAVSAPACAAAAASVGRSIGVPHPPQRPGAYTSRQKLSGSGRINYRQCRGTRLGCGLRPASRQGKGQAPKIGPDLQIVLLPGRFGRVLRPARSGQRRGFGREYRLDIDRAQQQSRPVAFADILQAQESEIAPRARKIEKQLDGLHAFA